MYQAAPCAGCTIPLEFELGMAFQPIVDVRNRSIFAHEALVRGPEGEPATSIFARVTDANRYAFDQRCRVCAVESAARLGMRTRLSINFMPNAVYEASRCLRTTLDAASKAGFPLDRIVFEATEGERVEDTTQLLGILAEYKRHGFQTAIDDFGAGYAGLNLLAEFQPDIVKLDMGLVRSIDAHLPRQAIVAAIVGLCRSLDINVVAEGVETLDEVGALERLGVSLMQGYVFGRPAFEALPTVDWPSASRGA